MNKLNARELNLGHYELKLNFSSDRSQDLGKDFEERRFFLTGEETAFNLEIESKLDKYTEKLFLVTWVYSGLITSHYIVARLDSLERKEYELSSEWLVGSGTCQYRCSKKYLDEKAIKSIEEEYVKSGLPDSYNVSNNINIADDEGTQKAIKKFVNGEIPSYFITPKIKNELSKTTIHTLGSYSVRDRSQYEHEKDLQNRQRSHQKQIRWMTYALFIFTAVTMAFSILQFLD